VAHRISDPVIREIQMQCIAVEERPANVTNLREAD